MRLLLYMDRNDAMWTSSRRARMDRVEQCFEVPWVMGNGHCWCYRQLDCVATDCDRPHLWRGLEGMMFRRRVNGRVRARE